MICAVSQEGLKLGDADKITQFNQKFFGWFRDQLVEIGDVKSALHRKQLVVILIDTLARAYVPDENNNKARFTQTVRSFGNWKCCQKVSIPQICYRMEELDRSEFTQFLCDEFSSWTSGNIIRLDEAVDIHRHHGDLLKFVATEKAFRFETDGKQILEAVRTRRLENIGFAWGDKSGVSGNLRKARWEERWEDKVRRVAILQRKIRQL